ncbi:uncharacterized protein A4U43_C09F2710 [Asparagus officinalis]|uniref:Pyruvate kinase n=1 Tax=Asparagus officinalis TaxID=4686 RepID=A0A5P1E4S8_ASPOF|nr:uncharacterized protein A4U43_C09F2710 [Asparagus officinalis]
MQIALSSLNYIDHNQNLQTFFPSLTKIVGTLGPKSHSVEAIEACLSAGMSVARFDFSWSNAEYHQEALDNLRTAMKNSKKLCAVMLDTMGPELQVCNPTGNLIELKAGAHVRITPDVSKAPSVEVLPIKYSDLAKAVKKGDTIFLGQYLFTGSETTSVWLEVLEKNGGDVICLVKNSAVLAGFIFTMHVSQVQINLPTLTDTDKEVISTWGLKNNVDLISLSYTRSAEDVRGLRKFLEAHKLHETQIYAKVENEEGLKHFDEILKEADGIILSRGNLGIDLPPEKNSGIVGDLSPTNGTTYFPNVSQEAVTFKTELYSPCSSAKMLLKKWTDGILLGAETLRGLYPVETIKTVGRICAEAEKVYNQYVQFKKIVKYVGQPMSHEEAVASSAVRAAIKVKAAAIVVFTSSGKAARLVSKYRSPIPVLAVVVPQTDSPKWSFTGNIQARQCLALRGVYPILATPSTASEVSSREETGVKLALKYGESVGLIKPYDRAVIFQKIGDSSVVKIVECQNYF